MPPKTKPETETPTVDEVDETVVAPEPDPVKGTSTELAPGGVATAGPFVVGEPDPVEVVVPIDAVPITFSVVHTTRDGIVHDPDTTAHLSPREARHVLHIGHGRHADAPTEAGTADDTEEQGR